MIERSRILVIEADRSTRELLADVLTKGGYVVVTEGSGAAGRARAIAQPFDLILSDIGLPDMDGVRLVRALRAAGVETPMLALSSHAEERDRERGLAAGFDEYLFKPIKESVLLAHVARRLAGVEDRAHVMAPRARSEQPREAVKATEPVADLPKATPIVAPRRRGVLGGLVVVAMGIPFVLQPLGVPNAASYLFIAMGAAFLVAYLRGQRVYLVPMVTLLSFGVALLLPTWFVLRPETVGPAFVGTVAIGFLVAFALAPDRRWPLVPAALLGVVAGARLLTGVSFIPAPLEPFLVPVVLVGVGTYLLIERPT